MSLVLFTTKKSLKMKKRNLIWLSFMKTEVKSQVIERHKCFTSQLLKSRTLLMLIKRAKVTPTLKILLQMNKVMFLTAKTRFNIFFDVFPQISKIICALCHFFNKNSWGLSEGWLKVEWGLAEGWVRVGGLSEGWLRVQWKSILRNKQKPLQIDTIHDEIQKTFLYMM